MAQAQINWVNCLTKQVVFKALPTAIHLNENEAIILLIRKQACLPYLSKYASWLSADELADVKQFKKLDDQATKIIGRALLSAVLSQLTGLRISDLSIARMPSGKPILMNPLPQPIHFNLSDSADYILLGFSTEPIGVDIEAYAGHFDLTDIVQSHFAKEEQDLMKTADNPAACFFEIWSRKEALLKANGIGLIDDLPSLVVLNGQHILPAGFGPTNQDWHVHSFEVDASAQAAVAVSQSIKQICFFDYLATNPSEL